MGGNGRGKRETRRGEFGRQERRRKVLGDRSKPLSNKHLTTNQQNFTQNFHNHLSKSSILSATLESSINREESLLREATRLQRIAKRSITSFVSSARVQPHHELRLRVDEILGGKNPAQIVSEILAEEEEQKIETDQTDPWTVETLDPRSVPSPEEFNSLIDHLRSIRQAISEASSTASSTRSSKNPSVNGEGSEQSFHSLDEDFSIDPADETVVPESSSTPARRTGTGLLDLWKEEEWPTFSPIGSETSERKKEVEESSDESVYSDDTDDFACDWEESGNPEEEGNPPPQTPQQPIVLQSSQPELEMSQRDIVARMQAKASEDLVFHGYYEVVEGTPAPTVTETMKTEAAEEFEGYLEAVGFAATFIIPANSTAPEMIERSRKVAFELGLQGEAKVYFDSLEGKVRRDYKSVLSKFRLRYIGGLDALEEKAKRKEALTKYQEKCTQGSKSLMRYLAEGVYHYEKVDPRYKLSENNDGEWDLEEAFIDGLSDTGLADTVRGRLAMQSKVVFSLKDVLDNVKYLRRRLWSNDEYTKIYNAMREVDLGMESSSKDVSSGTVELAKAIGKLADRVEKMGSQSGSVVAPSAPPSYATGSNRQQPVANRTWPMNPKMNCYSCGDIGHSAQSCTNPNKLSRDDTYKLIARDREARALRENKVNQIEWLSPDEPLTSSRGVSPDDGVRLLEAASVEIFTQAPLVEVATTAGVAAAEKRTREDWSESNGSQHHKAENHQAKRNNREQSNYQAPRVDDFTGDPPVHIDIEMGDQPVHVQVGLSPEEKKVRDLQAELKRAQHLLSKQNKAQFKAGRRKGKPTRATTRLLGDQKPLDVADILRETYWTAPGGARMSLAQWLDGNSFFRAQLAWYCQSKDPRKTQPVTRVEYLGKDGLIASAVFTGENHAVEVERWMVDPAAREARDEPEGDVTKIGNFYTWGVVELEDGTFFKIMRALIDGGAQISLINRKVVKKYNMTTYPIEGLMMRTATDEVVSLNRYVRVRMRVGQVWSTFVCYVNPKNCSYGILLSRRWLCQVRAMGEYGPNPGYVIRCKDDIQCSVPRDFTAEGTPLPEAFSIFRTSAFRPTTDDVHLVEDLESSERMMARDLVEGWSTRAEFGAPSERDELSSSEDEESDDEDSEAQQVESWWEAEQSRAGDEWECEESESEYESSSEN
ncbi:hypothetical protein BJ508DRAFT_327618 [Ascobolus immersus RN42]|uniref:CCHC-type domain-containing protein n=1 Tax=Ascobolus immersus RN42 TaxID=1160509 RepID=A0A3N4I1Z5_ASCIM|nr:hypothetical protein BJ508DRAFT_327618 [Ascobolus immersus RN42]